MDRTTASIERRRRTPTAIYEIDHVVVTDARHARARSRTSQGRGVPALRERETDTYGAPMVQDVLRLGQPILELIGPKDPQGDKPARFFGLAFTSEDLELTAKVIGDALHPSKDAVQPGRRIATLDKAAGSTIGFAIMSPDTKGRRCCLTPCSSTSRTASRC